MKNLDIYISEALVKKHLDTDHSKDFVDFDLLSKNLWCKYNLGATKETESGNYYAWAEPFSKKQFTWDNYEHNQLARNANYSYISKYNHTDKLTRIQDCDNAAKRIDPRFDIPVFNDFIELLNNNNVNNVRQTYNGVECLKIYLKDDPETCIYIPYAGYYEDNNKLTYDVIRLWCSDMQSNVANVANSFVKEKTYRYGNLEQTKKMCGLPIRPIIRG